MSTGISLRHQPNAQRLLWAGFFTIFAAGVGFGVRGSILVDWAREYGFTQAELGAISGGGLQGFGIIIILGSLIADRLGYGTLMVFAFVMHVLSAILQMSTGLVYESFGRDGVYWTLYISMFMFSVANGTCEVVVNPMVATLFPNDKTHYLNILHAGWPGGLIAGGLIGYFMNDVFKVHWIVQMSLFLVPVAIYGAMLIGQHLPRSEAQEAGISYGEMLREFIAPLFIILLIIHAMVGYVELGTDSWISKITGAIFESRGSGMLLFVYTSGLMFVLRFFAGPIERAISPLGILFVSAVLAAIGLTMLGNLGGILLVAAATVYGIGKTFFWPTMLAVVSERFPRGGAVTLGMVGGIGMLSAGFLGGPGIGFKQDKYATAKLNETNPETYQRFAADKPNSFLGIFETKGLDGAKKGLLDLYHKATAKKDEAAAHDLKQTLAALESSNNPDQKALYAWWLTEQPHAAADFQPVANADLFGGQMALRLTALVPATMAILYLLLILYFRTQGGYKRLEIPSEPAPGNFHLPPTDQVRSGPPPAGREHATGIQDKGGR